MEKFDRMFADFVCKECGHQKEDDSKCPECGHARPERGREDYVYDREQANQIEDAWEKFQDR